MKRANEMKNISYYILRVKNEFSCISTENMLT